MDASESMTPVPHDAPLRRAWSAYRGSDEFKRHLRQAIEGESVEGALWAAFTKGFEHGEHPRRVDALKLTEAQETLLVAAARKAYDLARAVNNNNQPNSRLVCRMFDRVIGCHNENLTNASRTKRDQDGPRAGV